MNVISQLKKYIKQLSNYMPIRNFFLKSFFWPIVMNIPLSAASHDTMITGRKQTEAKPVRHTSWKFANRDIHCVWMGLPQNSGDSSFKAAAHNLHKHTHEVGWTNLCQTNFGMTRKVSWASGLPIYWSCHTQAQTGRGVWFTSVWQYQILAGEFYHKYCCRQRLTTTAMISLFFQPKQHSYRKNIQTSLGH